MTAYGAERCDCCDLAVESCGRAVERRQRQEDAETHLDALSRRGVVVAEFDGQCVGCDEYYSAGTPIRRAETVKGWANALCCSVVPR